MTLPRDLETIEDLRSEVARLRGIVETGRHYVREDVPSVAYAVLCGMGLDDGIDQSLIGTDEGREVLAAVGARVDLEDAASALIDALDAGEDGRPELDAARAARETLRRASGRGAA